MKKVYPNTRTEPLADFRQILSACPDALYFEGPRLSRLLRCNEAEAEEVRRWVIEDGFEVAV